jgi:hypothetical protein
MYGDTAQDWDGVVAFYDGLARENPAFGEIASLAGQLAMSEYRVAGLQALTSMHDLLLGPSQAVLDNPFLRVAFSQRHQHFILTYEPGGLTDGDPRSALELHGEARPSLRSDRTLSNAAGTLVPARSSKLGEGERPNNGLKLTAARWHTGRAAAA